MTRIPFTKMHGTGNDYIYIDGLDGEPPPLPPAAIVRLSDRHFGIGGDGVVLISRSTAADFRMRIFNADGSEAEMCGNASRCVAKYLYERRKTDKTVLTLETKGGLKELQLQVAQGRVHSVRVDMGQPILETERIPAASSAKKLIAEPFTVDGQQLSLTCVSMGNPHAVFIVDQITDDHVLRLGPQIETNPLFPARTNVEFVQVLSPTEIRMRVWERGSGVSRSCGTGACASVVAAVLNERCERRVRVQLRGGELEIEWADNDRVFKSGPAEFVFDGIVELES